MANGPDGQNGPMGGGIDIDIETRQPIVPRSADERANEAKVKMETAVWRAISLQADLAKSPMLALMLQQFTNRLDQLAQKDPVCQTILGILSGIQGTIDFVPQHAHKRFKEILGANMTIPPAVVTESAADAIPESEPSSSPGP